jgi:hypothetical protein
LREAAQSRDTEGVRPCALNIQTAQRGFSPLHARIEHGLKLNCVDQQPNENEIAGLDLQVHNAPGHARLR